MTIDELRPHVDVEALAREIAVRLAPDALLEAKDVGALLKCSAEYVTEEYAHAPGFPQALRLTGRDGRKSKPRWIRADIVAWIEKHRNGRGTRGGRQRRDTSGD